ncbi:hypothetical protein MMC22_002829 [Lobaria immixta]|nr:hypothetical protein [Lobaria immixta]
MATPISQDNDPPGNDPPNNPDHPQDDNPWNDPQDDDPQNNPQNGSQNDPLHVPQNNNPVTALSLPQVQSFWGFETLFTTMYPFQHRIMSHLNRLEFSNLQLAGIRTPISQALQRFHLISSKCNEVCVTPRVGSATCSHTTRTVDEIKVCHGWHHDGWFPRGRRQQWNEPETLYKHLHDSDSFLPASDLDEGGQFDSFNVCIHCHERDRQRRDRRENLNIQSFRSTLCRAHCREFAQQQPYNFCCCKMFLEKYWRCNRCAEKSLEELKLRAQTFGEAAYPTFVFNVVLQMYIDEETDAPRRRSACPILGCPGAPWIIGPLEMQMVMCRACTAIFPKP